ncbi:hypothetical protein [Companilactobacillus ginsenosidimutans]|uniref:hypothetical protein n=1 Tax=Companilactobacillus ginsenosidimutans TaxID=1007676 RepID=UPI000A7A5E1E|nr:hypothetical protein [Companilactobacillus ginsenosidimutans]
MKKKFELILLLQMITTVLGFVLQIRILTKLFKIEINHQEHKTCHHRHHGLHHFKVAEE